MKQRMNRKAIISLIVAIVAIICIVTAVAICHLVRENKLEDIQNEILAELERNEGKYDERSIVLDSTSKARAEELAALFGAELRITENGRYARLMLPEGVSVKDIWSDDENREYLEEMSADYQVSIAELESEEDKYRLPMRPNYTVSDSEYSLQTYLDYINMQNVWSYGYTGSGVTVAVIDTGIDTDHPEFAGRISEYSYNATEDKIVKDWTTPDGNYDWSLIKDEQGHGTAVTGVIAGTMNSGNIIGIAPNVNIIVIKAECDELGNFYRTSDLVFGLYYAIERDVQVVNMSFGTSGSINPFAEATQLAYDSDIICVAAAGNKGTSALTWPAADENVIGVGALEENSWTLASYSNYGENSDIVAPGTTYTSIMGGKYGSMNGTSLSSPIVAGAIALFMQNNIYTTFDDVEEVLYASSYDLGALGEDWDYGYGALDVNALVLGERGTVTFDMLTDELENEDGLFIRGIALQSLPEPERLYAVFDGWYYDDTFTQAVEYYSDAFESDLTLYAKWVNEDDGVPYTYVILDDGTVEVRSYTGHRRFITVPEKIEGRVVSSIGDFAFSGQTRLREVGLPSGLTNIGRYAFKNCSNLVSIEIPVGVKKIGDYAFENNVRLYTVAFSGNSVLESIGDFAFSGCGNLERMELPTSLTSVNGSAFFGTTSLTAITVRNGNVAFISKDGVLFDITSTTLVAYPAAHGTTYTVPEGTINLAYYSFPMARIKNIDLGTIQTIGKGAFVYSTLDSLTIPDSVIAMGESAFSSNTNLAFLSIGRGLTAISGEAFAECSSLKTVTIPNGISLIDTEAFSGSGLASVVFESGSTLSAIGPSAFYDCHIREIDIPASVIDISDKAFSGFLLGNPLKRVSFASESQLTLIGYEAFAKCYPLESIVLPHSLKTIGSCAFMSSGLKNITVPASVTELGNGAFACCDALTSIEIEDGNTVYHDINGVVYTLDNTVVHMYPAGKEESSYTIESTARSVSPWAFAGTSKLGSVILPEGMTEIGEYGFYRCGAYSYSLPSTLVEIEQYAFSENFNLGNIYIPDNVLQIGRYAFAKSNNLYTVNFNTTSKLPRISYGAFAYSGIQYFTVPANVSTIAQGAFEGCKNLYSVTFAENSKLESISAYMFDGCENLQSITFNNGTALTSIQAHALEGMDNLTSINFGDAKLINVDNFAFRFCESISSITFPETLTNIGRYAFYGCKSLSELTVPVNVEHIGSYAFLGTNELDLYLAADSMPEYLDENWDHGLKAYYTGVTSVNTSGDYKYATLTSGNIAIIEYLVTAESVDLSTLDLGAPITTIGGSAFKDSTIKAVVLPETLLEIQAEAFMYTALESITIPASVTFIGREAFAYTDIAVLIIPSTSALKYIEQYAFEGTEYLKSVTLPASLEKMGTGVFLESGLETLIFADGIKLTEIPQKAFAETKLVSVSLPDSVNLVNHNAFNNVETLKSVSFGNNAGIRLMSNAFYHTGLTSLTIPANVTYIGEYCFVALPNLTEFKVDANNPNYAAIDGLLVTKSGRKLIAVPAGRPGTLNVPVSVEEIGFGAFEESKLSAINFDPNANILTFGYRAFFKAENITEINIPASVVSIDYYAFAYCENLKTVTFAAGNKLKGIYEGAFCGDINLENIVIPDSIVEISDFAFYGCSKITKLPVSETNALKGIYDYAFAYTSLSGEFTAPETLIDIGNYAFLGCKFTKVTVPDTNKKQLLIGIGAFEGCNQLTAITLPFIGASFEDEEISWFGYIFGAGSYTANETYVPASLKTVTITDGITFVGIGGFANCTGLETINVPHSVSVLYNLAFAETTARYEFTNTLLTCWTDGWNTYTNVSSSILGKGIAGRLELSKDVSQIDLYAFQNCKNLTNIIIPDNITKIDRGTFYGCSGLIEVKIGDSVTSIEESAFSDCTSLESFVIPYNVTSIGAQAFSHCSSLTSITIPIGVTSIEDATFSNCSSLTSIIIPESVTSIGEWAFSYCSNLSNITIPNGVTSISTNAFSNCSSLTSITIPIGVTSIEDATFLNCSSLASIIIPESVTSIGEWAFSYCSSLTNITIPNGVTSISTNTFSNCSSLTSITIPKSITSIEEYAFINCNSLFTVYNNSNLPLTIANENNGYLAYYAKMIVDSAGNKMYKDESSGFTYIDTADGFRFMYEYGKYTLLAYMGEEDTVTLPTDINGEQYDIHYFHGAKEVIIPEGVISIGKNAFYGCCSLTGITIPDSVTSIGDYAFYDCSRLTSVTIPVSLTSIANGLFAECTALTSITIPDGVTSIGHNSFFGCSGLTSLTIADSVTSIGGSAFTNCSSLTHITIPNNVTSIGSQAFYGCSGLTDITIPNGVTSIGDYTFDGCSSLTSVYIPNNVLYLASSAFPQSTNLIFSDDNKNFKTENGVTYGISNGEIAHICIPPNGNIIIPDGVKSIGHNAFFGCTELTSIIIPDSVTSIGDRAFIDCTSLISVTIPSSVTSIGEFAFKGCTSLSSIVIPDGVRNIGSSAFSYCSKLISMTIPNSITSIDDFLFSYCSNLTSITIPEGIISIGYCAFNNCSNLTSVIIPDSVTSIGFYAFSGCSSLISITIPDSVKSIGEGTFFSCTSITNITIPTGTIYIGDGAFGDCSSLKSIALPDGLTSMGNSVFSGCSSLKSLTIPNGITNIGDWTFYGCSSMTSIIIPNSVTSIGNSAFSHCSSLTSIMLPKSVTNIGESAFNSCSSLISITIPESAPRIGDWTFSYCTSLTSIIIPNRVTSIGDWAFSNCPNLTSIIIPNSVTSIGEWAFSHCSSLISITIPDGVTNIKQNAFYWCIGFTSITIPNSVTSIGDGAFTGCNNLNIVYNNSSLSLTIGSEENGSLAYYAKMIVDATGNKIYKDESSGFTYIDTADGFRFMYEYGEYTLLAYIGKDDAVTLPKDINGEPYEIYYFRGAKEVVILDGITSIGENAFNGCSNLTNITIPYSVTSIGSYAFANCTSLTNITIPDSVTSIGMYAFYNCSSLESIVIPNSVTTIDFNVFYDCSKLTSITIPDSMVSILGNAFYNTSAYNSQDNWHNGMLVIDGWLIAVDENVKYLNGIENIRGVASDAYSKAHRLLRTVWNSYVNLPSNVETLFITDINEYTSPIPQHFTLKNIIICDAVDATDLRYCERLFNYVTGVTIFVEGYEEDLRWDANFPGWSNGNRVVYGDSWTWANFYDADGTLLYSKPRLNSEIVRMPVVNDYELDGNYYKFIGWDLNDDGDIDSIPATSTVDTNAHAVYVKHKYCDLFGHTIVQVPAQPATCTSIGWNEYDKCSRCDYSTYVELPALTHDISKVPAKPATCTSIGWNEYDKCSRCDYSTYVELPALTHDISKVPAKPATCTEIGWNEYDKCSRCDYSTYVELPALTHDISKVPAKPATCTSIGWNEYDKCSRCDYSTYVELPMLDHKYISSVIKPDYQVQGYTLHTCEVCGYSFKDNYTDALTYLPGDINGDGKVEKADASVLIKYIVGENVTVIPEALDINRDGKVTIVDAITILLYLAGKVESLN